MNTAKSTSEDCSTDRLNERFRCGMRMGSRLCTNPHMKNNVAIMAKANRWRDLACSLFIEGSPVCATYKFLFNTMMVRYIFNTYIIFIISLVIEDPPKARHAVDGLLYIRYDCPKHTQDNDVELPPAS